MTDLIGGLIIAVLAGLIGWFGSNVWRKHGSKVANRFGTIERLGLAGSSVGSWYEKSTQQLNQLESWWADALNQKHVPTDDANKAQRITDRTIEELRALRDNPPDDVPQEAVQEVDEFISYWGQYRAYFVRSMPEGEFRNQGEKIRRQAELTLEKLQETYRR